MTVALALVPILALLGGPVGAGVLWWRVYSGAPWRSGYCERACVAVIVAATFVHGWLDLYHKIMEGIRP